MLYAQLSLSLTFQSVEENLFLMSDENLTDKIIFFLK